MQANLRRLIWAQLMRATRVSCWFHFWNHVFKKQTLKTKSFPSDFTINTRSFNFRAVNWSRKLHFSFYCCRRCRGDHRYSSGSKHFVGTVCLPWSSGVSGNELQSWRYVSNDPHQEGAGRRRPETCESGQNVG